MPSEREPHVLVVITEVGEPQVPDLLRSVASQVGVTVEVERVSDLGMREAQQAVHRLTHGARGRCDWVVNLGGDMVLTHDAALRSLVEKARSKGLGRYTEPVADWYTGRQIIGVHLIDPEAVPDDADFSTPFNDRWVSTIPGHTVAHVRAPVVHHAPDPAPNQALRFGLQRGIKAHVSGARGIHWHTISDLVHQQARSSHPQRLLSIAGAARALEASVRGDLDRSIVDEGSAPFAALLADLSDPVRRQSAAQPLVRTMGVARAHLSSYRSTFETGRYVAATLARRRRARS